MILNSVSKYSVAFMGLVAFIIVSAAPVYAVGSADEPQALVKSTTEKMFAKLKAEKQNLDKNPQLVYGLVSDIVLPHFDFITMSKWVLGKNWRSASRAQKIGFIKAFRELMVRTYSVALLEYTDSKIKYKPLRDDVSKGDVTVKTQVEMESGSPVAINYSLHKKKKGWKVYDISVEGVSLIANYRTTFASEVKQKGLDALIARLQKHNKKKEA
ncbi:Uncharacterized ABC transporter, auxiliary component YrbC [hydrothermal vent metagenome]|uniref:Uncharacterized ABC transporter, auxiliary component YrbC n=1 Tax=hydrothermal vent metagenome TaxID=652676 RepID=A0A3B1A5K3_9ZZZZ